MLFLILCGTPSHSPSTSEGAPRIALSGRALTHAMAPLMGGQQTRRQTKGSSSVGRVEFGAVVAALAEMDGLRRR